MSNQKVWFITGASKGFGREIARAALAAGDKVVATVRRNPEELAANLNNNPDLFIVLMDVTNEAEVQQAVREAIEHFGRVDVLVNNAGYGILTAIEEASDAEVRRQYDANVFGVLNVVRAVAPQLRKQRFGRIINISSLFAYSAIAGWALYGSTKFAIEGISQGLAIELEPFGIHTTAVAPGLFSTDFLSKESFTISANAIDDYRETPAGQMRNNSPQFHGQQPGDPKKLAALIVQLANTENPPVHLPIGKDAVDAYWQNAAKMSKEIDAWADISSSTDHDASSQHA